MEPDFDFEAIPTGKYVAAIVASEFKPTKAGDGRYLEFVFQVLEGECRCRQPWARVNLENKNETAVKIAAPNSRRSAERVASCSPATATNSTTYRSSSRCRPRDDNGEMSNEIKGYVRHEAAGAASAAAAGSAPESATPPWKE